jgi:hypothetical protein
MVTWNCDDTLVVTSLKNFIIKVWNSNDAQLIHELKVKKKSNFKVLTLISLFILIRVIVMKYLF